MDFEWDREKAQTNVRRHGVTFEEASEVFADDLSSTAADPDHSAEEQRFVIFGSREGRDSSSSHSQSVVIESVSSAQDR